MSKSLSPTRALFERLFDDAAMFPPGNASAADALKQHRAHRAAAYADLVGPLLVHVDRWGEFARAHRQAGSPEVDVVIIGSATAEPAEAGGIRVVGYEVAAPIRSVEADAERSLAVELERRADVELDFAELARLRHSGAPVIAKYRTGGTTPDSFPSQDQVSAVICSAVRHRVPLKFTAGLHHALRHTDNTTEFEHHGFINIAVAIRAAQRGAGIAEASTILGGREPRPLVDEVVAWSAQENAAVRSIFTSIGCCGVTDPIRDAAALGLLPREIA
ncbi:MAG: hypothetical protein H0V49_12710 [Nocardioidaceae bacterium]|nr:hypothetical protein [Nocardioidaceae bacterium]